MARGFAQRRPKGTGSISELKDGTGRVDAEVKTREWDGTETRHRKRLPSRFEGERWIRKVLYEHERDMLPSPDSERLTLGEYLDGWLAGVEGTVSRHTFRDYKDKVRLHIAPVLGKVCLRDLTPAHLQRLYKRKLLQEGQSPRSVRYIHVTLSKALHDA